MAEATERFVPGKETRTAGRQRRSYDVRRLPGFGAVAIFTFVMLYAPILILVVFSFNAAPSGQLRPCPNCRSIRLPSIIVRPPPSTRGVT